MWRLDTAEGSWAVKMPLRRSGEDEVRLATAFQEAAHAAGVPTPRVRRTTDGRVFADELAEAGAPFAGRLAGLRDELVALESWIEPPEMVRTCHRDLWADNVLPTADGGVCVIDWENSGPADPSQELGCVLFEFAQTAATDWLKPNPRSPERADSAAWIGEVLNEPHTRELLDTILKAVVRGGTRAPSGG